VGHPFLFVADSSFDIRHSDFSSRHRQFIKDFLDDRFAGLFLGLGVVKTCLATVMGRCHLGVMSSEQLLSRITVDPNVCHGKPCIRGLRYPVEMLLELLSGDMTEQQILADYPDLEAADLRAAIAYAARLSRVKSIERVAA
jgi:uncharacterized protein (DUF433 family)